jgi:prophage DNA circulation protein
MSDVRAADARRAEEGRAAGAEVKRRSKGCHPVHRQKVTLVTIHRAIRDIAQKQEMIMATLQEVKDAIAQVATDIAAEKAEVQALLQGLKDQIKALQDQIAAGTAVTAADLDGLVTSISAIDTGVKDISEPTVP